MHLSLKMQDILKEFCKILNERHMTCDEVRTKLQEIEISMQFCVERKNPHGH
jgi:glycine cleavage system regulatory protein